MSGVAISDPILESSASESMLSQEEFLKVEFYRRFGVRRSSNGPCPRCGATLHDTAEALEHWNQFHAVIGGGVEEVDPEDFGGELDWERYGFRGRVGKLLWERGLQKKAVRFVGCNKYGRPGLCSRYPDEHRFFVPSGCGVIFCKQCADEVRRELMAAYFVVVRDAVLGFASERDEFERLLAILRNSKTKPFERVAAEKSLRELWLRVANFVRRRNWVLAGITFTLSSDGSEITPARVRGMFDAAHWVMVRTVGSRKGYGALPIGEVGYETRGHLPDAQRVAHGLNLHCHGLYFGPRLDWKKTRDLWMTATAKRFGAPSRGFWISKIAGFNRDPERAIRHALNHMLKYTSKPPAVTPERLGLLIAAFDAARRVRSWGLFNGKKPKREKRDCLCPKCKGEGILSVVGFEGRSLPDGGCIPRLERIEVLLARGFVPLDGAGRAAVLSMGGDSS
jgi:hypothetical protein